MGMQIDLLARICHVVNRQINDYYRQLKLFCVIHHSGQREDAIVMEEHGLLSHPAGAYAINILKRKMENEDSALLGVAASMEKVYLGLSSRSHLLGVITLNADQYEDAREAKAHLYHLAWHATDLAEIREQPEYKVKFRNGPMIPRRSPMNQAKANLRADVFSAVMMALQGNKTAISELAEKRALASLTPNAGQRAEDYPYVIAMEAAEFAFREISKTSVPKNRMVRLAMQIAADVGMTFDETSIRQWWAFSGPAQDMAWRGHTREEILGAAINTSEDPYVRATGLLVSEIINIAPSTSAELACSYNAFADSDLNAKLHKDTVAEVFEGVIAQGMVENSSSPITMVANEQNRFLTEGRIIGWCASALHAAASAFENALASGRPPGQAARLEFEGARNKAPWDTVRRLGDKIIEQRRNGFAVTFTDIMEICKLSPEFAPFLESLEITMNDPAFVARLEAIHEMTPAAPASSFGREAPSAPSLMHGMPAASPPTLGGGARQHLIRQRVMNQQQGDRYSGTGNDED